MHAKDFNRVISNHKRDRQTSINNKVPKNEVTHTDFINFLEPFFEKVDEKKIKDLSETEPRKTLTNSIDLYKKCSSILKERLCNCFIFKNDFEFGDVKFDKELLFTNYPSHKNDTTGFFSKHNILDYFKTLKIISTEQRYKDQVKENIKNKKIILEILKERIKINGYFEAYDLIHKELENVYKRMRSKKKKTIRDIDDETIDEYLKRIDEFFLAFGDCDQFEDNATIYPDILEDQIDEDSLEDFEYLP